jgi:fermentation-respiration switch protein FrsA (DUF1100 family)
MIIKPRMISFEKGFQREAACRKFDTEAYKNYKKKNFNLPSEFGYILSCELMESPKPEEKKIAVLCHGLGYAKYGSIKYSELFLGLGFTVLMYDHRNHGLSGKAHTSMGFYEKYDLKKVIDWCYDTYGEECRIVTHGESMGAATVLMHLGIDNRVKCTIADCGYCDLKVLLRHQLKQYYHLPSILIPMVSCLTYLRAGFWYQEVSPIRVVTRTDTPILFIHGKIDNLVPAHMSKQMYACKKDKKAIYLVAKARHAESYCVNKEGYEKRVVKFLKRYFD